MATAASLEELPVPSVGQTKTIVEEHVDDQGRAVRVTRKICMKLVREKAFKKFGAAEGLKSGPDLASTILGEPVFLKLGHSKDIDKDLLNKAPTATNMKSVACRLCEGPHWTSACPFKDTFMDQSSSGRKADGDEDKGSGSGGTKYVPPAQRAREAAEAAANASGVAVEQDSTNTIRVSNLSDMVTEADLRDLCGRFGPVSRCFVAKDQYTGRCRGYAFVTFHSMSDAEKAMARLNGYGYGNMVLAVGWAKAQAPK